MPQNSEIIALENQIGRLTERLHQLQQDNVKESVQNYSFLTAEGPVSLLDLFGCKDALLVIHNMGEGCRYCTLWADGINGFVPHLESAMAVALVSKDPPDKQRQLARSRGWQFTLASHGGGDYIAEQSVQPGSANAPGAVVYERSGSDIFRKNSSVFGPGDLYCGMWHLLGLAGISTNQWTPQYRYWSQPEQLEDGGNNLLNQ